MDLAIEPVATDDVRLRRLLQLYIHEWSARVPVPIGPDALYAYPGLSELDAWLFVRGAPIGFALTRVDEHGVQHVKEMFVIAGARRGGLGGRAMHAIFAARPGRWTLTVRPENPDGLAFWRRTVVDLEHVIEEEETGRDGIVRTRISFVVAADR
ncbi:hypothetical protein [Sandaracinus amylolyticus]|uniref:hypothetical protein n=1 Tax=Sandaracinus amylolyticus TaxID=927083 RepID=UPI001F404B93|nr:hypothetical protein [Sandaracinus amylolyticus]UJR80183.1 N-acetyltransferase domain-containing protein [Sandaracinus amylolyticus]